MGSCVSRSGATSTASESSSVSAHALTATVVDVVDGSMAQFAAPVPAHEALLAATTITAGGAPSSPRFLCWSDALDFDAPVTALAAHDALRPGQLYFALPAHMLGRPLSARDMAALAVKACAALGTAPVVFAAAADVDAADSWRQQSTGRRVAPLVVVSAAEAHAGEWKSYCPVRGGAYKDAARGGGGGETVGKTRNGGGYGYKGVVVRDLAPVQRLSVIVEADRE